jgi:hypothetical protein
MTIKELIDSIGAARTAMALGVSSHTVESWRTGRRRPGTRTMRKAILALYRKVTGATDVNYDGVDWGTKSSTSEAAP